MNRYYGRTASDSKAGPATRTFRCDGYLESGYLEGAGNTRVALAELPRFLRALLVTDGTVTKTLEAYFWEPVRVETVDQRFEEAAAPVPWIEVDAGDHCLVRDARLVGAHSGRAYAEAFSIIRIALIPADFRDRLIRREIGIGVLIRDSGLESYREVLDMGLETDDAGVRQVFRTYRIVIDRRPVILITEYFPLALYRPE
jgi:chorismate-pyruvate lyase